MRRIDVPKLEDLVRHELAAPDEEVAAAHDAELDDAGRWLDAEVAGSDWAMDGDAGLSEAELRALGREGSHGEASPAAWLWWMDLRS